LKANCTSVLTADTSPTNSTIDADLDSYD